MKAVTTGQMQAIEQRSVEAGVSLDTLMENAGLAVANEVSARLGHVYGRNVVVLVGPGNNGSDGLVAARHMAKRGALVKAFALTKRPEQDSKRALAEAVGVRFILVSNHEAGNTNALRDAAINSDVVIDAVLGTGRARQIEEPLAEALRTVAEADADVVAIDLPTGMDADTGRFDPNGLRASLTLMLGHPKVGPLVAAGDGICGEARIVDIGIPKGLADDVLAEWLTEQLAATMLPARPGDANKGTFGRTLIIGGSPNYLGATLLSTNAAVRSGAGLVYLATAEPVYRLIAGRIEEAIYLPLAADSDGAYDLRTASSEAISRCEGMDSILIGPGVGQAPETVQFIEQLVRNMPGDIPAVLDADALNILSRTPRWQDGINGAKVLTPHPGEMSRLLGRSTENIQADRQAVSEEAARRFDAVIVLKGAATIIASPDGRIRISPWVNPGLAKAGTGDVLAGLIAGLLAQMPEKPFDAASLAVYLHGLAGNIAKEQIGQRGMTAGDVAAAIPAAFSQLESPQPNNLHVHVPRPNV